MRIRTLTAIVCAFALLAGLTATAQEKTQRHTFQGYIVDGQRADQPVAFAFDGQGDNTFMFVSSEMSFDSKVVKGAPYAAQAVTEQVQTLADGNRIVHRNTASVYRDSEGRTRREQTLSAVGNYAAAGDAPQIILINDPVAKINYILDSKRHTAQKIMLFSYDEVKKGGFEITTAKTQGAETPEAQKTFGEIKMKIAGARAGVGNGAQVERSMTKIDAKNLTKESLGKQTIEGVEAEGTRITSTIPAGEIGNEAPISVVTETWYSPELQTVIMSKHSDPRLGENTYRLTNISRGEQQHSLFELPSDYTVTTEDTVGPTVRFNIERELKRSVERETKRSN